MSPSKWRKKQRRHQKKLDYILKDRIIPDKEFSWGETLALVGLGLVMLFLLISLISIVVQLILSFKEAFLK